VSCSREAGGTKFALSDIIMKSVQNPKFGDLGLHRGPPIDGRRVRATGSTHRRRPTAAEHRYDA
jgi:hypothetical protein